MKQFIYAMAVTFLLAGVGPAVLADDIVTGEAAPDFELPDQNGDMHSLEDYRDEWVALYFYPKDDTPGCTTEACEFRDDIFKFRRMGAQVLGVSLDDEASHKEFAEKYGLPFPLLADPEGTTADAYGVKTRWLGISVAKRQTFLIDPQGRIAKHYADVNPETHSAELLADLAELTGTPPE
ncbi:MAG: peroxiredoxin [Gammaproteobacteria bacterium]|nr:peroxiredoxin [Gammaproteobacteria bacterium]